MTRVARTGLLATALALAALVSGSGCTGGDAGPAIPVDTAVIYAQMCARCHGVDGRGDTELKKTMPVRDFHDPAFRARATTDDMVRVMMAGKGQMPAFAQNLSLPKMQAMAGYVRRLGGEGGSP
jgi:mono/diheme cytochrome c family protein